MLKFRNFLVATIVFFCCDIYAQDSDVTLSIQQGHVDKVLKLCASNDGRFIASYGADQNIIIWEVRTASQFLVKQFAEDVKQFQFDETNLSLTIQTSDSQYKLNLVDNEISFVGKRQRYFNETIFPDGIHVSLDSNGVLNMNNTYRTSDYSDQPFNHFVYSSKYKTCYAASEDGNIYVFDSEFKFSHYLKSHQSGVNFLIISSDDKYLYSASSDRSIIQWNLLTGEPIQRFFGKTYSTAGLSLSANGAALTFGDEIGFFKTIHFIDAPMEIVGNRKTAYPITFTAKTKTGKTCYAGDDNNLVVESANSKTKKYSAVKLTPRLISHNLIVNTLNLYKSPYSFFQSVELSSNEKYIIYSCDAVGIYSAYYQVLDIEKNKRSPKLYPTALPVLTPIQFLNDSVFFSLDSSLPWREFKYKTNGLQPLNSISFWLIKNNNVNTILHQEINVATSMKSVAKVNDNTLVMLSEGDTITTYDVHQNKLTIQLFTKIANIYFIKNNLIAFTDDEYKIHLVQFDETENKLIEIGLLEGHQDQITSCDYDPIKNRLFTTSKDATVRIWNLNEQLLLVTIVPIGSKNAIYVTPDNYYMTTSKDLNSFGFKVGGEYFYPEQFDPVFNRPDIVLNRLGYVDSTIIFAYHQAYLKRIEKLGFTEEMLKTDFHLPKITIANLNSLLLTTEQNFVELNLAIQDTKYPLDRINFWINDVAIFGTKGISLRQQNIQTLDTLIKIPLALGLNKIQVSILNQAGAESYKATTQITCTKGKEKPDLYLISIGCSHFKDSKYNLNYAAKDAEDMATIFGENKIYGNIFTKKLLNEEVTLQNIQNLNAFLKPADINDEVILFFAGHGVLDQKLDYYLASHDMDFLNPADKGIPYGEIENLVDGIAPLKKIIFIDACHSGEVDKTEIEFSDSTVKSEEGDLKFRKVGNVLQQKESPLGLQSTSQLTKSLFADLRKGTGATVISSAGGMEFAIESNQWKNGLFTYCLLEGIKSKKADLNRDGKIMLSEIQIYVGEQVMKLSNGRQQPTSRIENNSLDYRVW